MWICSYCETINEDGGSCICCGKKKLIAKPAPAPAPIQAPAQRQTPASTHAPETETVSTAGRGSSALKKRIWIEAIIGFIILFYNGILPELYEEHPLRPLITANSLFAVAVIQTVKYYKAEVKEKLPADMQRRKVAVTVEFLIGFALYQYWVYIDKLTDIRPLLAAEIFWVFAGISGGKYGKWRNRQGSDFEENILQERRQEGFLLLGLSFLIFSGMLSDVYLDGLPLMLPGYTYTIMFLTGTVHLINSAKPKKHK